MDTPMTWHMEPQAQPAPASLLDGSAGRHPDHASDPLPLPPANGRGPWGFGTARRGARAAVVVALLGLPAPLAWAAQAFQESAGQVVIEAEHYDAAVSRGGFSWVLESSAAGFSGTGYATALPNSGATINTGYTTTSPELVYNVTVSTPGTYYVWIRASGITATDDTVHTGLDGAGPSSADRISGFSTSWYWKQGTMDGPVATVIISNPGLHTVHVWMREDGFRIDKLFLRTSSSSTAPTGTGPAESPRVTTGADTTPPSGTVTINSGAAATTATAAILSLTATDDSGSVSQMRFSNDGSTYSPAEAYAATKTWTLAAGDGTKTVYAQFTDAAGNWSSATTDTILLDSTPPTTSALSASNVSATGATLTWTTNEPATSQVDYGPTTSYGQSTTLNAALVTSHSAAISSLTASTLYHYRARSKDAAGNEALSPDATFTTSPPADTSPPTGSLIINGGAAATNSPSVTLALSATDNSGTVSRMTFSTDGATYSSPEPYATAKIWTLPSGDGPKTVSVKFADAADNWSAPASATITLDTTPPQISFTTPLDGAIITAP